MGKSSRCALLAAVWFCALALTLILAELDPSCSPFCCVPVLGICVNAAGYVVAEVEDARRRP